MLAYCRHYRNAFPPTKCNFKALLINDLLVILLKAKKGTGYVDRSNLNLSNSNKEF